VPNPKLIPVSGRDAVENSSELDAQIGAHRPGLTRQNQTVPQVFGFENVARRHVDVALEDGRHARTASPFKARVGYIDARIEQQVHQGLTARPAQPVSPTIQVDLDVCDF
jgi:hypothetical protein